MAKTEKKKATPKKPKLPLPEGVPAVKARIPKAVRRAEAAHLTPLPPRGEGSAAVLQRLWDTVEQRRIAGDAATSHSARLLKRGTPKVAQKLGEEAVELVVAANAEDDARLAAEAADLLYHLMVLLAARGVAADAVWRELERRAR